MMGIVQESHVNHKSQPKGFFLKPLFRCCDKSISALNNKEVSTVVSLPWYGRVFFILPPLLILWIFVYWAI